MEAGSKTEFHSQLREWASSVPSDEAGRELLIRGDAYRAQHAVQSLV